jgi:hypothetical protein
MTNSQQNTINRLARSVHGFISDWSMMPYSITNHKVLELDDGFIQVIYSIDTGRWHDTDVFIAVIIGKRGGITKYSDFRFIDEKSGNQASKAVNDFMQTYACYCNVKH